MIGRIKHYDRDRGFGFIQTEGGSFFFHATALRSTIDRNSEVEFYLDDDPRTDGGLKAVDIRRVFVVDGEYKVWQQESQ